MDITFLPVYKPSEAERGNPELYAKNVQRLMARELNIPASDDTYYRYIENVNQESKEKAD
jgi:lysophosphatidylcholine acyltransferase/lyso-PAF acetyltransferase